MLQKKTKEHNQNWSQSSDHLYRLLIIWGSGSGKTNLLFNLESHQPNIKTFIYMLKIDLKQNVIC